MHNVGLPGRVTKPTGSADGRSLRYSGPNPSPVPARECPSRRGQLALQSLGWDSGMGYRCAPQSRRIVPLSFVEEFGPDERQMSWLSEVSPCIPGLVFSSGAGSKKVPCVRPCASIFMKSLCGRPTIHIEILCGNRDANPGSSTGGATPCSISFSSVSVSAASR